MKVSRDCVASLSRNQLDFLLVEVATPAHTHTHTHAYTHTHACVVQRMCHASQELKTLPRLEELFGQQGLTLRTSVGLCGSGGVKLGLGHQDN